MAEKTEKATPKKLRDARKKGQVAKSQDLPQAFTFIASIAATIALIPYLYDKIADFTSGVFQMMTQTDVLIAIPSMFMEAFMLIFITSIPILAIVAAVGVLINFLAVGPTFAIEVFKPDIKKFNPVENLKAKFKLKTLVELVKSLFKIFVAAYLIYTVMWASIPDLIKTVSLPLVAALTIFKAFLIQVVIKVGLFFIVVAILDYIYQKQNFAKEMMMDKFEVKQEYKNTEGDPLIKSRRRQLAQEIAYQEGPSTAVKRSKAVVTNPTHLAIALAYDKEIDSAPYITYMGQDAVAERIISLAEKFNIPIIQNIPLAHKLWDEGELYEYVPEETYEAVAEVLKWIASLEDNPKDHLPEELED